METNNFSEKIKGIRNNLTKIELIELSLLAFVLGLAFGILGIFITPSNERVSSDFTMGLIEIPLLAVLAILFLWGVYMLYIRMARAGGKVVDIAIWVIMAIITSSVSFWCWTILDLNRLLMTKLIYKGETPVEYAWSAKSKAYRKAWEEAKKQGSPVQSMAEPVDVLE